MFIFFFLKSVNFIIKIKLADCLSTKKGERFIISYWFCYLNLYCSCLYFRDIKSELSLSCNNTKKNIHGYHLWPVNKLYDDNFSYCNLNITGFA